MIKVLRLYFAAVIVGLLVGSVFLVSSPERVQAQANTAELWGYLTFRQPITGTIIPINSRSHNVTVRVTINGQQFSSFQTFTQPWYYVGRLPQGSAQVHVLYNGLWNSCGFVRLTSGRSTQFNCRLG